MALALFKENTKVTELRNKIRELDEKDMELFEQYQKVNEEREEQIKTLFEGTMDKIDKLAKAADNWKEQGKYNKIWLELHDQKDGLEAVNHLEWLKYRRESAVIEIEKYQLELELLELED